MSPNMDIRGVGLPPDHTPPICPSFLGLTTGCHRICSGSLARGRLWHFALNPSLFSLFDTSSARYGRWAVPFHSIANEMAGPSIPYHTPTPTRSYFGFFHARFCEHLRSISTSGVIALYVCSVLLPRSIPTLSPTSSFAVRSDFIFSNHDFMFDVDGGR
ncbi:hypothetical protein BDZ94DRAFT_1268561 [Collybia nuda]|uniref:Uncharacterized protein n=1 Tax=Collybia nuda TaxID=64659 RepID=A0A9P5XX90_9AGAR|nr:hypothetical protein BDZ94DRAFT_1268561 [Collybia nuda]